MQGVTSWKGTAALHASLNLCEEWQKHNGQAIGADVLTYPAEQVTECIGVMQGKCADASHMWQERKRKVYAGRHGVWEARIDQWRPGPYKGF